MAKKRVLSDLSEDHHIVRYCNRQLVEYDPVTGEIRGVFPAAFELRSKIKEEYLSVGWFEYFTGDSQARYKEHLKAFRSRLAVVRPDAAIAKLKVGAVLDAGKKRGHILRVRNRSHKRRPGYAGVYNMPKDNSDSDLLRMFANECCLDVKKVDTI